MEREGGGRGRPSCAVIADIDGKTVQSCRTSLIGNKEKGSRKEREEGEGNVRERSGLALG